MRPCILSAAERLPPLQNFNAIVWIARVADFGPLRDPPPAPYGDPMLTGRLSSKVLRAPRPRAASSHGGGGGGQGPLPAFPQEERERV